VDSQLNAKIADLELGVSKSAVKGFYRKRRNGNGNGTGTGNGINNTNYRSKSCLSCLSCLSPSLDDDGNDDDSESRSNGTGRNTVTGSGTGRNSILTDIRESISNALAIIEPIEEAEHILANWAAPEFIEDGCYTQASDVYALGMVMWEIASKQLPFDDVTDQELLRRMVSK